MSATETKKAGGDRGALVVGGTVLAACLGLVLFGVFGGFGGEEEKPERKVPTAAVTYEVTGKGRVEVSYLARSEEGRATVEKNVELPWKKTVRVPLGQPPTVNIVLDGKGGEARCALAIRGRHVQTATAFGTYGRATCSGELPAPETTEEAAS
ncbi:hypothetical protein ACIG0D_16865 [Streptomyces sp. NPDC052773]|jgi:hypothetical protein|uniref:hypothetical protein n=1 Tax=Streptomyces sp. NPDC052773 TaxID=3365693 RepID=UPI0037D4FC5F